MIDSGDISCSIAELRDIVYTFDMIVNGLIQCNAMIAENKQRECLGHSMTYTEQDFKQLIDTNGIHHNALIDGMRRY